MRRYAKKRPRRQPDSPFIGLKTRPHHSIPCANTCELHHLTPGLTPGNVASAILPSHPNSCVMEGHLGPKCNLTVTICSRGSLSQSQLLDACLHIQG